MMCRYSLMVLLLVTVGVFCLRFEESENFRDVTITQGTIRGYKTPGEHKVFGFYDVPYATAPSGIYRFQAPLPPPTWTNIFEAVDRGIVCPQGHSPDVDLKNKTMQEDCLIANIFVPDNKEQNLSVLVYVHGGGFQVGYGNQIEWTSLVKTKNILVINFNYRLGILGNLCLGTDSVPGNAGMKDQVALLQWVKRNIASFGGDPSKITIAGCSTGSVSVDLLALSDTTKGLFNKMIINSGCSLNVFAIQQNPLEIARTHVKNMKLDKTHDVDSIEKIYKTASVNLLTLDVFDGMKDSTVVFSPCVERENNKSFLSDAPFNMYKKHNHPKIPIMYSFVNMEGLLRISKYETWMKLMNEEFTDFMPADLQFVNENEKETIAKMIKDFYFKDVKNNRTMAFVDYFTDVMFVYGILKSIEFHIEAGHDNVYLMEYSFTDANTPVVANSSFRGANHCSQVVAVADENDVMLSKEYKAVKETVRDLWSNFIKTGEPTGSNLPHWPAVSQSLGPILSLNMKSPILTSVKDLGLERRFSFWNEIYKNHYHVPIPAFQ